MKLFFSEGDSEILMSHIRNYYEENILKLENLEKIKATFSEKTSFNFGFISTLDFGIKMTKCKIRWLQEHLKELSNNVK